jgi:hypothetical protein
MLRSHRLLITALVGLALQPIGDWCHAQTGSPNSQQQPAQRAEPVAPLDLAPINQSLNRIHKSIEALKAAPESPDEYRRAEGDLIAQEEMARWAMWMTIATIASVLVSGVGVVAVIVTLRQNAHNTRIAMMGVKRSSQSIRLAKDTARRQLRAYIGIRSADIQRIEGIQPKLSCKLEAFNSGQTPAYALVSKISFDLEEKGEPKKLAGVATVGAQTPTFIDVYSPEMEGAIIKQVMIGVRPMRLWGRIDYKDAFGAPQYVTLRLEIQRLGSGWRVAPADDGNEST